MASTTGCGTLCCTQHTDFSVTGIFQIMGTPWSRAARIREVLLYIVHSVPDNLENGIRNPQQSHTQDCHISNVFLLTNLNRKWTVWQNEGRGKNKIPFPPLPLPAFLLLLLHCSSSPLPLLSSPPSLHNDQLINNGVYAALSPFPSPSFFLFPFLSPPSSLSTPPSPLLPPSSLSTPPSSLSTPPSPFLPPSSLSTPPSPLPSPPLPLFPPSSLSPTHNKIHYGIGYYCC